LVIENLNVHIEIANNFHRHIKLEWTTLENYIISGKSWLDEIANTYNDESLNRYAQDILRSETHFFAVNNSGKKKNLDPTNLLIMKGGGIKGLAYVGALEEVNKYYNFNWFAGTSAGAITAILLSAEYTTEELKTILSEKNFNDFKDALFPKACLNLFTKSGFYEANTFLKWLNDLLAEKLNSPTEVRLIDLPKRTTIYASKRSKSVVIFDSNITESQKTSAAFAARCSMSIPLLFTPQKSEGLNVFDGGLQNNFPIKLLLENNPDANFLAFYLGEQTFKWKKNNVFGDVFKIWTESSEEDILREYKDQIIVIDPSPISTLNFKLNKIEKEFLIESGRLAALKFLDSKKLIDKNLKDYNFDERKKNLDKTRTKLKNKKKRIKLLQIIGLVIIILILLNLKRSFEISQEFILLLINFCKIIFLFYFFHLKMLFFIF
jgi:predicted acylesterase/phospholipase RssA